MPPPFCRCLFAGALLFLAARPAVAQTPYPYNIIALDGASGGFVTAVANGLNNNNQVAVTLVSPVQSFPFPSYIGHAGYYDNGVYHDSQPGSPIQSYGSAISDSGLLGLSVEPNQYGTPAIYNLQTDDTRYLNTYAGQYYNGVTVYGINASGDAIIEDAEGDYLYHYSTGQSEMLNDVRPGASNARAINNSGLIVGTTEARASYYSKGAFHQLPSLVGVYGSQALGVNNNGDIVGGGYVAPPLQHAFLYHNGQIQDLGTLQNDNFHSSLAEAINDEGDIVGGSGDLPFIYRNGKMENLFSLIDPSLGWTDGGAIAINDNGWIIGHSSKGDFLMIPNPAYVPEPGSLLTFGVGIGVLLFAARRRKRARSSRA